VSGSFHVHCGREHTVPISVTFHVSEEVFEDAESVPHDMLAREMVPWLTMASEHYRREHARARA
jgi:hypothetical protein